MSVNRSDHLASFATSDTLHVLQENPLDEYFEPDYFDKFRAAADHLLTLHDSGSGVGPNMTPEQITSLSALVKVL
jgi:hypothetical protein